MNPYAPPGASPYAAPAAPPPGAPRPGLVHVRINMALQALLLLIGLFYVAVIVINIAIGSYDSILEPPSPGADPAQAAGEALGGWMAVVLLPIWSGITLLWAPLNLYGLWKLQPWGRVSTIVYSALSFFTCCCMPFGIYALVSLLLPSVRALFTSPGASGDPRIARSGW